LHWWFGSIRRGLNRQPKTLSQSGICRAREKWRGEMIGGALLPVKSIASDEFYVQSSDHTRIAFTRDAVGKVDGAVLNPGPWQQRGAIVL
jgi:hypothetical protein